MKTSKHSPEFKAGILAGAAIVFAELCRRGEPEVAADIMGDFALSLADFGSAAPEDLAELRKHEAVRRLDDRASGGML